MKKKDLSPSALGFYLHRHLAYELKYLFCAATEWEMQETQITKSNINHLQEYVMCSVFIHSRCLFEFLTEKANKDRYDSTDFGLNQPTKSKLYNGKPNSGKKNWKIPLHSFVLHLNYRNDPQKLIPYGNGQEKDLHKMPVDFAREILRLWNEFSSAIPSAELKQTAEKCLDDAIANSIEITNQYGKKPLFKC